MLPTSSSLASYVGTTNLQDYTPVVDVDTDVSAVGMQEAFCDLAMGSRMFQRAIVRFTWSGAAVAVNFHDAVWGNSSGVVPGVARNSTGSFTITWPTTVFDALGVERSVNLRAVLETRVDGFFLAYGVVTGPNTVNVFVGDTSGALADPTFDAITVVVL